MIRRLLIHWSLASLALLVALCGAEIYVRHEQPTMRTQIVRAEPGVELYAVDGVPVWQTDEAVQTRQNLTCPEASPEAPRVLFFGSSITYGSGVSGEEVFTGLLRARRPDLCVMNRAQPGFTMGAKVASAQDWIAEFAPDLVFFELWNNDGTAFTLLGDAAYNLAPLRTRPDGYPDTFPLPGPLNRWLFTNSRLYEFASLTLSGPSRSGAIATDRGEQILELDRQVRAGGGAMVLVTCPWLDRPFSQSIAFDQSAYRDALEVATTQQIPVLSLSSELVGREVEAVRLDPCCHYNAAGHELLAEIFIQAIAAQGL